MSKKKLPSKKHILAIIETWGESKENAITEFENLIDSNSITIDEFQDFIQKTNCYKQKIKSNWVRQKINVVFYKKCC